MIKAEIKNNITFPKEILVQDDLMHIAEQIFVPSLQANIDREISIDGSPFPKPEPSTVARSGRNIGKRIFTKKGTIRKSASNQMAQTGLLGFAKKILVETGKLRRAFWAKKKGKNAVILTLEKDRLDIGKYLQIDGIQTKHGKKFYRFFGITDGMRLDAKDYANTRIKEACNQFNGR